MRQSRQFQTCLFYFYFFVRKDFTCTKRSKREKSAKSTKITKHKQMIFAQKTAAFVGFFLRLFLFS